MSDNAPDYKDDLYFPPKPTLTEQWHKGELPAGWYYVKYKSGKIEPAEYQKWFNEKTQSWYYEFDFEEDVDRVIMELPNFVEITAERTNSFNEIKKLKEQIEHANRLIQWVRHSSWSCNQEEDDFDRYVKKWGVE